MYEYTLHFRWTEAHVNAGAFSRLPLPTASTEIPVPPELLMQHIDESTVTANQICARTRREPTLDKVLQFVQQRWPSQCEPELTPFLSWKTELFVHDGYLVSGTRVVIPSQGSEMMLQELHQCHMEMSKMKSLARMYVWWPSLDKDIEDSVCACRSVKPISHSHPQLHCTCGVGVHVVRPGYTVTMQDHFKTTCSLLQSMPIQRGSKVQSATSSITIDKLRSLFAQFGLPEVIVADNGSCFVCEEFKSFLYVNGIKHITSVPYLYQPRMTSQRAVQIEKRMG